MEIWYTAVQRFDPSSDEKWEEYLAWSGLRQLREVISLDEILCPSVIRDLTSEDWVHNVHEDFRILYFSDLDYLIARVRDHQRAQILAIGLEPKEEASELLSDPRFTFYGYDLIEDGGSISALTNCGGFDLAFQPYDISEVGLISGCGDAKRIQCDLRRYYPGEPHADCEMWAIWRMDGPRAGE